MKRRLVRGGTGLLLFPALLLLVWALYPTGASAFGRTSSDPDEWEVTGNDDTDDSSFLGTIAGLNFDVHFRTDGFERMRIFKSDLASPFSAMDGLVEVKTNLSLNPTSGFSGDLIMPLGSWKGFVPPAGGPTQGDLTLNQGDLSLSGGDLRMPFGEWKGTLGNGDLTLNTGDLNIGVYPPGFVPTTPGNLLIANGQLLIGTENDPVVTPPGEPVIRVDGVGRFPGVGTEAHHVVFIKGHDNPNDLFDTPDGLAIQLENSLNNGIATPQNNFVTFFDGFSVPVGAIEGDGSGGVTYKSGGADFAEYLERMDPADVFEVGEIVGVSGGKISRQTGGADHILVVTGAPVVLGNAPPLELEDLYERVAFLGQVPVLVLGDVNSGDYILPSGLEDGTGIAVAPEDLRPEDMPLIVGTAWSASVGGGGVHVTVALGLKAINWGAMIGENQAEVDDLQEEVDGLKQRVAQLEAMIRGRAWTPSSADP